MDVPAKQPRRVNVCDPETVDAGVLTSAVGADWPLGPSPSREVPLTRRWPAYLTWSDRSDGDTLETVNVVVALTSIRAWDALRLARGISMH